MNRRKQVVDIKSKQDENLGAEEMMKESGKTMDEVTENMADVMEGFVVGESEVPFEHPQHAREYYSEGDKITLDEYEEKQGDDGVELEETIHIVRPIDKVMKGVNKKRLINITAGVAIVSGGLFVLNQLTKKDVSGISGKVMKVAEKVDEVNG